MNVSYIIIMLFLLTHGLLQIYKGALDNESSLLRKFTTQVSLCSGAIMLLISPLPFGSSSSLIKEATNTKIGNEIIVQTDGMPTQIVTDIIYVDRKVQIVETTHRAVWGWETYKTFKVEIID